MKIKTCEYRFEQKCEKKTPREKEGFTVIKFIEIAASCHESQLRKVSFYLSLFQSYKKYVGLHLHRTVVQCEKLLFYVIEITKNNNLNSK